MRSRVFSISLAALLLAAPGVAILEARDEVQAPRAQNVALLREDDIQAPVSPVEVQAPASQDEVQAPRSAQAL